MHGTGWVRRWRVPAEAPDPMRLGLSVSGDYAFDFECEYRIAIDDPAMTLVIGVRNFGSEPIPVGRGVLPCFPGLPDTNLQLAANAFYPREPDRLPMDRVPIPQASRCDDALSLPENGRDNGLGGGTGQPASGNRRRDTNSR